MDGDIGGETVRIALRKATGPVHERLHQAPPFAALARGESTREDYAALLGKLGAYYFAASAHVPIDPARLALLRDDLATLGVPSPVPPPMAGPQSPAARLGWRYVVDGSIFGGRVIYRQLDPLFGEVERGRRFFRGTSGAAAEWKRLSARLERAGTDRETREEMIEGATAAFAAFEHLIGQAERADA
jgi:heme oxygenase